MVYNRPAELYSTLKMAFPECHNRISIIGNICYRMDSKNANNKTSIKDLHKRFYTNKSCIRCEKPNRMAACENNNTDQTELSDDTTLDKTQELPQAVFDLKCNSPLTDDLNYKSSSSSDSSSSESECDDVEDCDTDSKRHAIDEEDELNYESSSSPSSSSSESDCDSEDDCDTDPKRRSVDTGRQSAQDVVSTTAETGAPEGTTDKILGIRFRYELFVDQFPYAGERKRQKLSTNDIGGVVEAVEQAMSVLREVHDLALAHKDSLFLCRYGKICHEDHAGRSFRTFEPSADDKSYLVYNALE